MQYITTPMWSVPLFKTNIGKPDIITMAWIKNQHFPEEATDHDHTANKYILNEPKLKKLKSKIKQKKKNLHPVALAPQGAASSILTAHLREVATRGWRRKSSRNYKRLKMS